MNEKLEQYDMRDPSMGHPKDKGAQEKKAMINRISRAIGHLESIKRMVEDDRDPSEILIQLAAVRSAISGASRVILQDHIEECIANAMENPDQEDNMEDLHKIISYFIK